MSAITTVILARQNKYIRVFQHAGAVSPGTAIRLTDHGLRHSFVFDRLVRMGVIIPAGEGFYYLDEQKEEGIRKRRIFVLIFVAILLLIVWIIFMNIQR